MNRNHITQLVLFSFLCLNLFMNFSAFALKRPPHESQSRIQVVNGEETSQASAFKRFTVGLASVDSENPNDLDIFCTGSLIAPQTILTAAHCINKDTLHAQVVFGLSTDDPKMLTRSIVAQKIHENYEQFQNASQDQYDIAIIRFSGELPPGYESIQILEDDSLLTPGKLIEVAGYGYTDGIRQTGIGTLRETKVAIQNPAFGKLEFQTDERKTGTCQGDSGGPAILKASSQLYLIGVTARGTDNCTNGDGIYTKTTPFTNWMRRSMEELSSK